MNKDNENKKEDHLLVKYTKVKKTISKEDFTKLISLSDEFEKLVKSKERVFN